MENKFGMILTSTTKKIIGSIRGKKAKRDVKKAIKKLIPKDKKDIRKPLFKQTEEQIDIRVDKAKNRLMKKASFIYKRGKYPQSAETYRKYATGELAREKDKIMRSAIINAEKLRMEAKRIRLTNPRKAVANYKKARLIITKARRESKKLSSVVTPIINRNSQTLKRSILSGLIPGGIAGLVGYEALLGTEQGLERLLRHSGTTCAGDNYSKNKWKCPEPKEWYVEQTKYIENELERVRKMNRREQITHGLTKGAEEIIYLEAFRTLGINPESFPGIVSPQLIQDYESQGIALGTIIGGTLGAAQYLSKKGAEKLRTRVRRFK